MKTISEKLKNNWRKLVSAVFILLAFLMPATRDFLSEIFDVTTYASNNKNPDKNKPANISSTKSESIKSVSCPDSHQTLSPMKDSQNSSPNNHSHSNTEKKEQKPNGK